MSDGLTEQQQSALAQALYWERATGYRHVWWHDLESRSRLTPVTTAWDTASQVTGVEDGPAHTAVWLTLALWSWPGKRQPSVRPPEGQPGDIGAITRAIATVNGKYEYSPKAGVVTRMMALVRARGNPEAALPHAVGLVLLARGQGTPVDYVQFASDMALHLAPAPGPYREDQVRWLEMQSRWTIHREALHVPGMPVEQQAARVPYDY